MHWAAVFFLAASVCGSIITRDSHDISLAKLIGNNEIIRAHKENILRGMSDDILPYEEGLLQETQRLNYFPKQERECVYLRKFMNPQGLQSNIDISPHADYPDQITGEEARTIKVHTSTAKITGKTLGWNKEESRDLGGSVTLDNSLNFGVWKASLSVTAYGNWQTRNGESGESSEQTEYKSDIKFTARCPPYSICRVVTWTYTRIFTGTCFLLPYLDGKCLGGEPGKYSVGLFPSCDPVWKLAFPFLDYDLREMRDSSPWPALGPDLQGVKMPRPGTFSGNKKEGNCTFSYALKWEDGSPVRGQALIIDTRPRPVPEAIEWIKDDDGTACRLAKAWFWKPPNQFFVPVPPRGAGQAEGYWENHSDWKKPGGHEEKCSPHTRPEEDTGPEEDTELSKRAEAAPPSKNTTTRIEIILDDVPRFLAQLAKTKNQGFVPTAPAKEPDANKARSIAMREEDKYTAKECLAKRLQNTKQ
ncbi:hypothetical protein MGU_03623 [Metarhizium guizhouense ARSEF 977]|uniref:Uncharacterized protein n=1 Tax=Metarhizium guizhouense (strain ARSEF 977) TaxID=1276136 RepID=A0A0B4HI88_METGA|nr:hypothetical protein MGU_03623 [Metarhizium guizhouense ARSEF 977]